MPFKERNIHAMKFYFLSHSRHYLLLPFILLLGIALLISTCKRDPGINLLNALPDEMLLNIPTYDGSGQCVHPDILLLNPPVNGNHFLLAFTPYPDYNARLENPSILVSSNGVDFHNIVKGMNPLVPAPPYDHNDDPDLLYDAQRKKYYLHYLQTMRPDSENIIRLESDDMITWTSHPVVHFDLKHGDPLIVSPCMVLQNDEKSYRSYYVNLNDPSGTFKIQTLYSPDGLSWDKSNVAYINTDLPTGLVPWHLDVFRNGSEFVMLCSCRILKTDQQHQKLMMATSTDGLNWHFRQQAIMESNPAFHKCLSMYRSTGIIQDKTLAVWYSMVDTNSGWWIGVKKFNLDTL